MAEIDEARSSIDIANFPLNAYERYEQMQESEGVRQVKAPSAFPTITVAGDDKLPTNFALLTGVFDHTDSAIVDKPYDFNPSNLFSSSGLSEAFSKVDQMKVRLHDVLSRDTNLNVRDNGEVLLSLLDTIGELNEMQIEIHVQRGRIEKG
jgi:hypothetical protein